MKFKCLIESQSFRYLWTIFMNLVGGFSTQIILNKPFFAQVVKVDGTSSPPNLSVNKKNPQEVGVLPQLLDLCLLVEALNPHHLVAHLLVRICPDHDHHSILLIKISTTQSIQVTLREKITVRNAGNPNLFSNRTTHLQPGWIFQPAMSGLPECIFFICNLFWVAWIWIEKDSDFPKAENPGKSTPHSSSSRCCHVARRPKGRRSQPQARKGWCV